MALMLLFFYLTTNKTFHVLKKRKVNMRLAGFSTVRVVNQGEDDFPISPFPFKNFLVVLITFLYISSDWQSRRVPNTQIHGYLITKV